MKGADMLERLMWITAGFALLLIGPLACDKPVCEAGRTQICTCDGTDVGAQVCVEDGSTWSTCECTAGDDDDDVADDDVADDDVADDDVADDDVADDDDTGDDDTTPEETCADAAAGFDFEGDEQGFAHAATDGGYADPWEYGTPAEQACASGDACWATRLDEDYGNCEAGALLSPTFDLSTCAGSGDTVSVTFQHLYRFEAGTEAHYDGGAIQLSADGGLTWEDVVPTPEYTGVIQGTYTECVGIAEIDGHDAWSSLIDGDDWAEVTVSLDEVFLTDAFQLRFLFGSDRGVADDGWFIDDVAIVVD
jgi:hypothetical protein